MDVGCCHCFFDPVDGLSLSFLQLKETSIVNVSVITCTTRGSSTLSSSLQLKQHLQCKQVDVTAYTTRGCTTRGSFACLLCDSKNTCSATRLPWHCITTRGLCLSVLQLKAKLNGECKCCSLHVHPVFCFTCLLSNSMAKNNLQCM